MPQEMNETWTAKSGDTVAYVEARGNAVYLCLTADPDHPWIEVNARTALRMAYLLVKYSIVASFSSRR